MSAGRMRCSSTRWIASSLVATAFRAAPAAAGASVVSRSASASTPAAVSADSGSKSVTSRWFVPCASRTGGAGAAKPAACCTMRSCTRSTSLCATAGAARRPPSPTKWKASSTAHTAFTALRCTMGECHAGVLGSRAPLHTCGNTDCVAVTLSACTAALYLRFRRPPSSWCHGAISVEDRTPEGWCGIWTFWRC